MWLIGEFGGGILFALLIGFPYVALVLAGDELREHRKPGAA